jgi:hypothetical protein
MALFGMPDSVVKHLLVLPILELVVAVLGPAKRLKCIIHTRHT